MLLTSPLLPYQPQRIISLVPSQTELLHTLGADKQLTGITKFCIHPKQWQFKKTIVGGTKNADLAKIAALQPDLIIANKEENTKEQIESLAKDYPVWVTDVDDLNTALQMISDIGRLTGHIHEAESISNNTQQVFNRLLPSPKKIKTAYLIWRKPYMAAGAGTFIHDMLQLCGFDNICALQTRYPVITIEYLLQHHCELLLLSSEPYPFNEKHVRELEEQLPQCKIVLADGEMFSWYGSRLLHSPAYFAKLIQSIL